MDDILVTDKNLHKSEQ